MGQQPAEAEREVQGSKVKQLIKFDVIQIFSKVSVFATERDAALDNTPSHSLFPPPPLNDLIFKSPSNPHLNLGIIFPQNYS